MNESGLEKCAMCNQVQVDLNLCLHLAKKGNIIIKCLCLNCQKKSYIDETISKSFPLWTNINYTTITKEELVINNLNMNFLNRDKYGSLKAQVLAMEEIKQLCKLRQSTLLPLWRTITENNDPIAQNGIMEISDLHLQINDLIHLQLICCCNPISYIKVSGKLLKSECGAETLVQILKLDQVTHLDLSWNQLNDKHAEPILKAIGLTTQLLKVNLNGNLLSPSSCKTLTNHMKDNHTVQSLHLAFNNIGEEGAIHLSEMLTSNTTIKDIDLRSNRIGPKGATRLVHAIKNHRELPLIKLRDNNLGKEGAEAFATIYPGKLGKMLESLH